jgi:hypothetical protein
MKNKKMFIWMLIAMGGVSLSFAGGTYVGGVSAGMMGLMGGALCMIPLMQMMGAANQKRFMPLFETLKDNEKFIAYPDKYGKLGFFILPKKNSKSPKIYYIPEYGIIDDKGTEYAIGKDPISFMEPGLGMTIDIPSAEYTWRIRKEKGIIDYEEMVKTYLGDERYKLFQETFRKIAKPDVYDIYAEINWLKDQAPQCKEKLAVQVFGQTWEFKDFLAFLKYAFNPTNVNNIINTEKIAVKMEALGYKPESKAFGWAKAVVLVLFGLMIFLAVLSILPGGGLGGILKHYHF